MLKKTLLSILFLMVGVALFAAQPPGATCATAIPLGDNYSENITGSKTVWYIARTFDLPLSVYFIPEHNTDPKPEVEMDFSCTPGVYEDSIICSLFCTNAGSGIQLELPHKPALKTTTIEGKTAYYLAMGKEYRDLLLKAGIDYNVNVYVKVVFKSAGTISIAPDDMFTSCMDGAKFMHFDDTVQVYANKKDRHVIVPYVQWQEDSIRYIWEGSSTCKLAIANECEFDPEDGLNPNIIDGALLKAGRDTLKVTSALLREYVRNQEDYPNEAGMYFVKWFSESNGTLKIERIPMAPPQGGATLLRYDKPTPVAANDLNALYAIPYTWDTAVIFTTPTDHIFRMYIGTTHEFTKETAIASYQFSKNETGHWLGLRAKEMKALWTHATEQYLYIRFECSAKTTVTPSEWLIPFCMNMDKEIKRPTSTFDVAKGSYGAVYYRLYYSEWVGGDMTFKWSNSTGTCPVFIGDTCDFAANKYDAHVIDNFTVAKNGTKIIPAADLTDWADGVDADGYVYIRFNPSNEGTMTVSTDSPDEVDPAPIVYPAATIAVVCDGEPTAAGQKYIVHVSATQELNLYAGPVNEIASRTPIETWTQTDSETHTITLKSGIYTLKGTEDAIQIEVP